MTKSREEAELASIMSCAFGVTGDRSELGDMNTIGGAGFRKTSGTDTSNILTQSNPLGKQETVELARQSGCYTAYIDE